MAPARMAIMLLQIPLGLLQRLQRIPGQSVRVCCKYQDLGR